MIKGGKRRKQKKKKRSLCLKRRKGESNLCIQAPAPHEENRKCSPVLMLCPGTTYLGTDGGKAFLQIFAG